MTEYDFVNKVFENRGRCANIIGRSCRDCPIYNVVCSPDNVLYRAKVWLENYEKEHKMDGIKVTVVEKGAVNKEKYPIYMKCFKGENKGTIVCFVKDDVGFAFGKPWVGTIWDKSMFAPFHGTITIEVE